MIISLHSLPSSFPSSREVNCKQICKSEHCFSALKQSGTILGLYKHNFTLLELTADKIYASIKRVSLHHTLVRGLGCVWGDHKDHQVQWQSLQPTQFMKKDGSWRAAGLSWAVAAEGSSVFFPLIPYKKNQFRLSLWAGFTLQSDCCSILLERVHSCGRVLPSFLRAPLIAGGSAIRVTPRQLLSTQGTESCWRAPGVMLRMGLQQQPKDHVIEGQRLVS